MTDLVVIMACVAGAGVIGALVLLQPVLMVGIISLWSLSICCILALRARRQILLARAEIYGP